MIYGIWLESEPTDFLLSRAPVASKQAKRNGDSKIANQNLLVCSSDSPHVLTYETECHKVEWKSQR